jgi:hypothetical protein
MKRKPKTMPRITEADFTAQVIALAQLCKWSVCHFRPAKTAKGWRTAIEGDAGFPDIIACRNGRRILAELKVGNGKPTPEQLRWLKAWGSDAYLWYPRDWDKIVELFTGGL